MFLIDMASSRQGSNITSSEFTPDIGITASRMTAASESPLFGRGTRAQLLQAREILELGLANVSYARHDVALSDGKDIADVGWAKVGTGTSPKAYECCIITQVLKWINL